MATAASSTSTSGQTDSLTKSASDKQGRHQERDAQRSTRPDHLHRRGTSTDRMSSVSRRVGGLALDLGLGRQHDAMPQGRQDARLERRRAGCRRALPGPRRPALPAGSPRRRGARPPAKTSATGASSAPGSRCRRARGRRPERSRPASASRAPRRGSSPRRAGRPRRGRARSPACAA